MEGYDPARTRAAGAGMTLPINRSRAVPVRDDEGSGSPLAIARNTILVDADRRLRALDLETGKERWSFGQTGAYLSPAVAGNTVFIRSESNNEGQILALDIRTGKQLWAFTPRRLSSAEINWFGGHLSSPVVVDGVVFIGAGKELYALDAANGKVLWEYGAGSYVVSSATIGAQQVFISDVDHFYAIDRRAGKLAWKVKVDFSIYFSPVVAGETVFFTNGEKILALGAADGAKRWEAAFAGETLVPSGAQGNRLFVKSTTRLHALDSTTGKELWRFDNPNFVSFPAIAGEQLFAVTGAGGLTSLAALDIATGKAVWRQDVPALAAAAPIIAGGSLYVRTTDGRLLAFFN